MEITKWGVYNYGCPSLTCNRSTCWNRPARTKNRSIRRQQQSAANLQVQESKPASRLVDLHMKNWVQPTRQASPSLLDTGLPRSRRDLARSPSLMLRSSKISTVDVEIQPNLHHRLRLLFSIGFNQNQSLPTRIKTNSTYGFWQSTMG